MATLKTQIQIRRDTAANLAEVTLVSGEPAYATDTKKFAIGDGSTKFKSLPNSGFNVDMVDNFHFTTLGYAYQKTATVSFKRNELVNADDFIYVKMTCSNKYTSQQLRFKVVPGYDNVAGSTEVTTYSRQQNAFYLDSVYYNGNKFIGIYQPSANTDIYYLKFAKFTGTYASSPNNGSITVYSKDSVLTLTLIQSGHTDYETISKYNYITVPENGIYSTYVWNTMTPRANNAYDLGSSSYKWRNIHGVTIYENGTSLANKYQAKDADLTAIAALTGTGLLKRTGENTWALDTNSYLTAEADTLQTVTDRGATTTNGITVDTLSIGNTAATGHINFARGGWNYIKAPNTNSIIGFITGKSDALAANATLAIDSTSLLPGWTDGVKDIGSSSYQWGNLYMKGNIIKDSYTLTLPSKTGTVALTSDIHPVYVTDLR